MEPGRTQSGAGLFGAVVVVRDLARSEEFYREVLDLRVEASSPEAVLLSGRSGDHLALRMRSSASHVSAGIGVLFLVWQAETLHELDRCEDVLRGRHAFVSRSGDDHGWQVLEGRDPDDIRVIVVVPTGDESERTSVPSRVYDY
ncbi:MAG TPA: VOC family protein [Gaiellaceae bacterium]|nr:VOC family protein [Gaiellaceae bacterium]